MQQIPEIEKECWDDNSWYLSLLNGSALTSDWTDEPYRYYFDEQYYWDINTDTSYFDPENSRWVLKDDSNNLLGFIPIPQDVLYQILLKQLEQ